MTPSNEQTCGATIGPIADKAGSVLTCSLPKDHPGPVHSDHGHAWGDTNLRPADFEESR